MIKQTELGKPLQRTVAPASVSLSPPSVPVPPSETEPAALLRRFLEDEDFWPDAAQKEAHVNLCI
jgi:hypothetical protein